MKINDIVLQRQWCTFLIQRNTTMHTNYVYWTLVSFCKIGGHRHRELQMDRHVATYYNLVICMRVMKMRNFFSLYAFQWTKELKFWH